jgi:hypothetical protein
MEDFGQESLRETLKFLPPSTSILTKELLPLSAWRAHVPMMDCIIRYMRPRRFVELGSHFGGSFFAACRAVREYDTKTLCTAIDTWQGDEHAGQFATDVFDYFHGRLKDYADFATSIRGRFADAVGSFEDGSIDLLHIDGYHTYEAVRGDFETWLPKVAADGVVLLHDTCVRTGTFGVYRFWDELSTRYPCVNMAHDFGLGVVAVGSASTPFLRLLRSWAADPSLAKLVVDCFSFAGCATLLGDRCAQLEAEHAALRKKADTLMEIVEDRDKQIETLLGSNSWYMTRPVRAVTKLIRKFTRR